MILRPIAEADWPRIVELEVAAYDAETPAVMRSRAAVSPSTCFAMDDGGVIGYLISLPYPEDEYPDLRLPETGRHDSTNLHLHDVVVDPAHRRRGLGRTALAHLRAAAAAEGYTRLSLCAVFGADAFWSARGFRPSARVRLPRSYGPGAVYMTMPVDDGSPDG